MKIQPPMIRLAYFAPQLTLKNVEAGLEFYKNAFGALEMRRWNNPDKSVHVAEMTLGGAMFHLHEESSKSKQLSPETLHASTLIIGVFVNDPAEVIKHAVKAG